MNEGQQVFVENPRQILAAFLVTVLSVGALVEATREELSAAREVQTFHLHVQDPVLPLMDVSAGTFVNSTASSVTFSVAAGMGVGTTVIRNGKEV